MNGQARHGEPWSHLAAFQWYCNRLQNVAVGTYAQKPEEERYERIRAALEESLEQIREIAAEIPDVECQPPFCPDPAGICEPCTYG